MKGQAEWSNFSETPILYSPCSPMWTSKAHPNFWLDFLVTNLVEFVVISQPKDATFFQYANSRQNGVSCVMLWPIKVVLVWTFIDLAKSWWLNSWTGQLYKASVPIAGVLSTMSFKYCAWLHYIILYCTGVGTVLGQHASHTAGCSRHQQFVTRQSASQICKPTQKVHPTQCVSFTPPLLIISTITNHNSLWK